MKWSWRIGRNAGIDIDVHATFAFLILYIAIGEYQRSHVMLRRALDTRRAAAAT